MKKNKPIPEDQQLFETFIINVLEGNYKDEDSNKKEIDNIKKALVKISNTIV